MFRLLAAALSLGAVGAITASQYSGSSGLTDPCAKLLQHLYPFGGTDSVVQACDDCSEGPYQLPAGQTFRYFGASYPAMYISNNGLVSFGGPVGTYTALQFPISGFPVVAPFWADVDTRGGTVSTPAGLGNQVYWRMPTTPNSADVIRMASDVATTFPSEPPFTATVLFVVTWYAVGYFAVHNDKLNTFQVALASDSQTGRSFATMCFDQIIWDCGDASGGTNGFGPNHPNSGFNDGAGNYYSLPQSFSSLVLQLACGANTGCYTFRIDTTSITPPADIINNLPLPAANWISTAGVNKGSHPLCSCIHAASLIGGDFVFSPDTMSFTLPPAACGALSGSYTMPTIWNRHRLESRRMFSGTLALPGPVSLSVRGKHSSRPSSRTWTVRIGTANKIDGVANRPEFCAFTMTSSGKPLAYPTPRINED